MSKLAIDANAKPIQVMRPQATERVSVSGTSAQSTAIPANCRVIRIISSTDCFYTLDSTTATSSDAWLPAGVVEYIHVYEGDQIAVIQEFGAGYLYITEMY